MSCWAEVLEGVAAVDGYDLAVAGSVAAAGFAVGLLVVAIAARPNRRSQRAMALELEMLRRQAGWDQVRPERAVITLSEPADRHSGALGSGHRHRVGPVEGG